MTEKEILGHKVNTARAEAHQKKKWEARCLMLYREAILSTEAAEAKAKVIAAEYEDIYGNP